MPTLLVINGFRFFFYSNESNEPVHVHVVKGDGNGKVWLEPRTNVAYLHGFTTVEEQQLQEIIEEHSVMFKSKWYEYFGK